MVTLTSYNPASGRGRQTIRAERACRASPRNRQGQGLTLITAESCTAGRLATSLSQAPGAAGLLHGGFFRFPSGPLELNAHRRARRGIVENLESEPRARRLEITPAASADRSNPHSSGPFCLQEAPNWRGKRAFPAGRPRETGKAGLLRGASSLRIYGTLFTKFAVEISREFRLVIGTKPEQRLTPA